MTAPQGEALRGVRVLVTRPAHQAGPLCARIQARGGQPLCLPMIAVRWLDVAVGEPAPGAWIVFTSANAVEGLLRAGGPLLRMVRARDKERTVVAIGPATRRRLESAGISVQYVPKAGFTSEALLERLRPLGLTRRSVVLVKGIGGRPHLQRALEEAGARVAPVCVYRREPVRTYPPAAERAIREGSIDAAMVTSGEILEALDDCLTERNAELKASMQLVAGGGRVAGLAKARGFGRVAAARDPSDTAMLEALTEALGSRPAGL